MNLGDRFAAGVLAAALLLLPLGGRAQSDKSTPAADKSAQKPPSSDEKPKEPAAPADVTTEGAINAGGQHIAYTATAGTIAGAQRIATTRS